MLFRSVDRSPEVGAALARAYAAYSADTKATTPAGFREYLESARGRGDAAARETLRYLDLTRKLLSEIKVLGLTETELEISRRAVMRKLRIPNVDPDEFRKEIEKSGASAMGPTDQPP